MSPLNLSLQYRDKVRDSKHEKNLIIRDFLSLDLKMERVTRLGIQELRAGKEIGTSVLHLTRN